MEEILGNELEEEITCTPSFSTSTLAVVASGSTAEPATLVPYQQGTVVEPHCASEQLCPTLFVSGSNSQQQQSVVETELTVVDGVEESSVSSEKTMHNSLAELAGSGNLDYKTLWQLSAYSQEELPDQFFVPALQDVLPPVVVRSTRVVFNTTHPCRPYPCLGGLCV